MSTELTRRALVLGLVASVGGGAWFVRRRNLDRGLSTALELAETVGLGAPSELGSHYLEAFPNEAEPDRLVRLLFPDGADAEPAVLAAGVAERIRRDWEELETVQLDGWIVSRTEGRFLAMVALPK